MAFSTTERAVTAKSRPFVERIGTIFIMSEDESWRVFFNILNRKEVMLSGFP